MIFSNNLDVNLRILIDGVPLEIVSKYKTLGVILENDLSFNKHVNYVITRVCLTLRGLYNVACYLPLAVRYRVAVSTCLPLFLYCLEIYSGTSATNILKLRRCFNRVIRYIYGLSVREHVSEYQKLILGCTFDQYINMRKILFFYKTVKYGNPSYLLQKFIFGSSSRTHALIIPRHFSIVMSRSYCVTISRLWNSMIPYEDRRFSHSLSNFKLIFLSNL